MICSAIPLSAAATPRFSDTSHATIKITYSGDMAYCIANFYGADGTTSISNGVLKLVDSNGIVVGLWSGLSATGQSMLVTKATANIVKGETYTLIASATINRNGSSETIKDSVSSTY